MKVPDECHEQYVTTTPNGLVRITVRTELLGDPGSEIGARATRIQVADKITEFGAAMRKSAEACLVTPTGSAAPEGGG